MSGQEEAGGGRREERGEQDRMWRADETAWRKVKGVGDVCRIWKNTGWDQREEQGLRALGGNRVKK